MVVNKWLAVADNFFSSKDGSVLLRVAAFGLRAVGSG